MLIPSDYYTPVAVKNYGAERVQAQGSITISPKVLENIAAEGHKTHKTPHLCRYLTTIL